MNAVTLGNTPLLLVEDDASLRRSLQEFFSEHGYRAIAVDSNRRAWEAIRAHQPAVCIVDLNLPDGSGLDLLRRIVHAAIDVRVIVMTALPLQHLRPNYPREILAAWLAKPVAPAQLLDAVRETISDMDKYESRESHYNIKNG